MHVSNALQISQPPPSSSSRVRGVPFCLYANTCSSSPATGSSSSCSCRCGVH
jgi:hypothetical protein